MKTALTLLSFVTCLTARGRSVVKLSLNDTAHVQFVYSDSMTVYYETGAVVKAIKDIGTDTIGNALPAIEPYHLLLIKKIQKKPGKYIVTYMPSAGHQDKVIEFDVDKNKQIVIRSSRQYGDFIINKSSQIIFERK